MDPGEHSRDGRIRYRFPTPIAAPYRLSRIARTPVVRLGHVLGTIDELVRFLTWVLLADYLGASESEGRDEGVEASLGGLERPTTERLFELLAALARAAAPAEPFLPELRSAIASDIGDQLASLVRDAAEIAIEPRTLDEAAATGKLDAIAPRVEVLLSDLSILGDVLLVQMSPVSAHSASTWTVRPWRGVGNARPLVVSAEADSVLTGAGTSLLVRAGSQDALRLDPFVVAAPDGRLMSLLRAPGMRQVQYEDYASGQVIEWDVPLGGVLGERALRPWRVSLALDADSARRLDAEVTGPDRQIPGYSQAIPTAVEPGGDYFRAIHDETGRVHNVVVVHPHLARDPNTLRRLTESLRALGAIEHPNVVPPAQHCFDAASGGFVVGSEHPSHGRLIDRLPPGARLPVDWSARAADSLLAALDALAERRIYLSRLPAWAVSLDRDGVSVVPFLVETEGRVEDAAPFVARLLYRMLTGEKPLPEPMAPSLMRSDVPEGLERVVLNGLAGRYRTPLAMRADLRTARATLDGNEPAGALSIGAVQRVFAHLQRLRPGPLVDLEARAEACAEQSDADGALECLHAIVEALWDPDERLSWVIRLVEAAGATEGRDEVLGVYRRIVELAGDHLPTLRLAAATYRDSLRGSDRMRLYQRILHAASSEDEVAAALGDLAGLLEERRELESALEHWNRYVLLRPSSRRGWQGVCRIQRVLGDELSLSGGLASLLERTTDPDERLDLVRELAVLRAGPLGDPRGAVDLLREVVAHSDAGAGAWEVLRDLARDLHDDALLVEALAGLARCPDVNPNERYAAELEQAVVLGIRGEEPLGAVAILDQLAQATQGDEAVLSYRAQILSRAGLWLEAAHALESWAAAAGNSASLGLALKRLAVVSSCHLGEPDRAIQLFEGVLETDPTDREALVFLDEAYSGAEDWPHLAQVLTSRLDVTADRDGRLDLLRRLASVQDEHLGDASAAFHSYGRLLVEDPRHPESLARFVELADSTEGWEEAGSVVEAVLPHLSPERAKDWRHRLGQMRLDHAEDLTAVVAFFREAVEAEPEDLPSLEGLVGATARIGAWAENAQALEKLADLATSDEARVARLHPLAETLRDRVLAPRKAAAIYERILDLDPEDGAALRGLSMVAEGAGRTARERVRIMSRWVELCADPIERLESLEAILSLASSAGLDTDEIAVIWEDVLELDPANPQALAGMLEHQRAKGAWDQVLDVLDQMIETAGSADKPGLILTRAGVQLDDMQDPSGAADSVHRVIQRFPEHPVAPDLLERVLLAAGQADGLVELLEVRADRALREEERADLLFRAGRVRAQELADEPAGVALMVRAVAQDPGHVPSLEFLVGVYLREGREDEALPLLESLVVALDEAEEPRPEDRVRAWCQLGDVREKLGEDDRAEAAFTQALGFDAESVLAQLGLSRAALRRGDYDLADERLQLVLESHGDALTPEKLARVQQTLGDIALARGDDARSRDLLEQALAANPESDENLRELVLVCERQGDWEGVARHRQLLASRMEDPLERFAELMELAGIYRVKLGRDDDARVVLEEARDLKPDSVAVPVQLLEVYIATGRYKQAVDTLQALVAREDSPERRVRYTYTLALLYRDHLHEPRKAVAYLNDTLDLDPSRLDAFEAMDRILVKHKDWTGQAKSYQAMLRRINGAGNTELEFRLYRNLAKIFRTGLGQPEEATVALARALERHPEDIEVREELARAREDLEPDGERAIAEYRRLLALEPSHKGAWKALGRIFARRRNRDAAWCVCGVLRLLGLADEKEQAFYAKHQKPALALRKGLDGADHWERYLCDPHQDRELGRIFEIISRALGPNLAVRTLRDLGLGPKDAVSLRQKSRFTGFLGTVSKILKVPIPAVYRAPNVRGLRKEPLYPPAMLVGPEVLTGRKGKELRFMIGKTMAYFLPAHQLAGMYPVGHLRTMLLAAMRTVMPEWSQGGEPGVRGVQKQLEESLAPRQIDELRHLVTTMTTSGRGPNLNEWQKQVERTANHAGHLLSNDLDVSVRMLKEERQAGVRWSKLPLKAAVEDLALFTVSDPYLALRQEVGAAILE